jgi:hypothetical protein
MVEAALSSTRRQRRLLVVWGVFALLAGAIVALEIADRSRSRADEQAQARDPRALVPVTLAQIGAVEIAHAGSMHRFERDASGAWFYHGAHAATAGEHAHRPDPEQSKRIEQALRVFSNIRTEREFGLEKGPQEYGLATPEMVILVYAPAQLQPLAQFAVGARAPDGVSRYIMAVGGKSVVTIPNYQIDDNLLPLIQVVSNAAQAPVLPPG